MHLFNDQDMLKKYGTVSEIIDDYYETRLELYSVRKLHLINVLERELVVLSNKAKYVQEILDDTIDLRRKTKIQVIDMLSAKQYAIIDSDTEYKYLTKMSMDSVSDENVAKMWNDRNKKADELELVKIKSTVVMWEEELMELEMEYSRYRNEREKSTADPKTKVKKANKSK
jgi:DNA topoisomerase-2